MTNQHPSTRRPSGNRPKFYRPRGNETGQTLIDALQSSPHREIEIEPGRRVMPILDLLLSFPGGIEFERDHTPLREIDL